MNKPFWTALGELKGEISVFWTENCMYVEDDYGRQATTTTTLFQAYRFASLINTPQFDYDASDKEVKELQKELLEFYKEYFYEDEKEKYIVDVWEYLDDIADDYKQLTGVDINSIDNKRAIVSYMSETNEEECRMGYGSGTYIARLISDHIIGDERHNVKRCNSPIAIKLAEKYLDTSDYDIIEFAKALHNTVNKKETINIRGSIWINNAKYEYVDYLVVTAEEVEIYQGGFMIGSIERDKINTIEEQYVELDEINNLEDVIDFDIKKVGDF